MSGNPLFRFMGNSQRGFKVIETKRSAVAPSAKVILERPGEGRCEERPISAGKLPDVPFSLRGTAAWRRPRGQNTSALTGPLFWLDGTRYRHAP